MFPVLCLSSDVRGVRSHDVAERTLSSIGVWSGRVQTMKNSMAVLERLA